MRTIVNILLFWGTGLAIVLFLFAAETFSLLALMIYALLIVFLLSICNIVLTKEDVYKVSGHKFFSKLIRDAEDNE